MYLQFLLDLIQLHLPRFSRQVTENTESRMCHAAVVTHRQHGVSRRRSTVVSPLPVVRLEIQLGISVHDAPASLRSLITRRVHRPDTDE